MLIVLTLLFLPATYLYVWCRLTPRWYYGGLADRLGVLVATGAADALESGAGD
jgi:hypothetical protein